MAKKKAKWPTRFYWFGWAIISGGVIALIISVVQEARVAEPIYLILAKVSSGTIGLGGAMVGIRAWRKWKG